MKRLFRCLVLMLFPLLLITPETQAQADDPVTLRSPDEAVRVTVVLDEDGAPTYAVQYQEQDVVLESPVALDINGDPSFAQSLKVADVQRRSVDSTWQRLWGRRTNVRNHFNEMTLALVEIEPPSRRVNLVVRAYDDGVAFRYVLPEAWGDFALAAERSSFRFPGTPTVWAANFGGFHSSQERLFVEQPLADLAPDSVYGLPMLVKLDATRWALVTEADLTDWAGMYLTRAEGQPGTLVTALSPHPDEPDVVVASTAPRASPWRVVMLAEAPGALLASDLIQNLNDPPEGDFSWVEPGIASWNWWNGPYLPGADFEVGMNTATMKAFVDLSAEMGWAYVLVDAGWYQADNASDGQHGPASDITAVIPALDLPELIRYAHEQGVKVLIWLNWRPVLDQMDDAFPLYEQWGVDGVKVDFMDRDDQEMVNFYHRVAKTAAAHHLMVDFHGAYKPTGVSRTYPNLVTREGVLGNEYNKWSALVTPEHTVTIPFTRGAVGAMDFTPGGFLNKTVEDFYPRNVGPFVMGTRVHQLAMFVVYESALQVASDSPYSYHSSPAGTDFLKLVPTTWDDTRVLNGYPGDYVTVARRSGDAWFVASMSDEEARTLDLPLDFLGAGSFDAEIWADAYEAGEFPDRLMKQQRVVTAQDTLTARMAPGGGYLVRLMPAR